MISGEDQRRLDEIARSLRTTDPEFVARMGLGDERRRRWGPTLIAVAVLLWAAVPAFAYAGGWLGASVCTVLVAVAGTLAIKGSR
ncbi:DUF3040 domain-containing protein [Phytohabitans aurantiacus]|jgi:hypothetical protein|uniref:DUF3040 domain-containing protein n=1 Tax=Phytohabitans aurantiacus TaxID=3016789 RepID=A0ABQ5R8B4_9ACTN|nr:DUF3040 domain-containing protein [Phytohabitans aurantiacus]GLI03016.1 hypothetical protein Pa4123_82940 [Phytohabitans aurantiacus]